MFRELFRKLFHEHKHKLQQYSTGGGWMADVYEYEKCEICGKERNWTQIY